MRDGQNFKRGDVSKGRSNIKGGGFDPSAHYGMCALFLTSTSAVIYLETSIQRRIQNPAKHLRWGFRPKYITASSY